MDQRTIFRREGSVHRLSRRCLVLAVGVDVVVAFDVAVALDVAVAFDVVVAFGRFSGTSCLRGREVYRLPVHLARGALLASKVSLNHTLSPHFGLGGRKWPELSLRGPGSCPGGPKGVKSPLGRGPGATFGASGKTRDHRQDNLHLT